MGESNEGWGQLETDEQREVWDSYPALPEAGENAAFDNFLDRKNLTREGLLRVGAKMPEAHVIAFAYEGGPKYRDIVSGKRWNWTGATYDKLKIVRAGAASDTVIVCEGETDAAWLSDHYSEADIAVMPVGARAWKPEYTPQIEGYKRVLIGLDTDDAGNDGAKKITRAVPHAERFAPPGKDWCEANTRIPFPVEPDVFGGVPFESFDMDFGTEGLPDWLVKGLIERGTVNILSSDTGVGKTWWGLALTKAALRGETFLGREVHARNVGILDEENPSRVIQDRFKALGVEQADLKRLRYSSQQGVEIGSPDSLKWLEGFVNHYDLDLCILDTALAVTNIKDMNDNTAVVKLYKSLKAVANKTRCAILILAHERKRSELVGYDSSQALMGARQWVGQADTHITLTRERMEEIPTERHSIIYETYNVMRVPKNRGGAPVAPTNLVLTVEQEDDWMLNAEFKEIGRAKDDNPEWRSLVSKIAKLLEGGPMTRAEIAAALGKESNDGALARALKADRFVKPSRGSYALVEEAMEEVPI